MYEANSYSFSTFADLAGVQTFTSSLTSGLTADFSSFLADSRGFCGFSSTLALPLVTQLLLDFLFKKSGQSSQLLIGSSKNSSTSSMQKLTSLLLYFSPQSLIKLYPELISATMKQPFPLNCFFSFSRNMTFKIPGTFAWKYAQTSLLLLTQGRFLKFILNGCPAGQLFRIQMFLAIFAMQGSKGYQSSSTQPLGPPNYFSNSSSQSQSWSERYSSEWYSSESEGGSQGSPSELQQFAYSSYQPPYRSNLKTKLQFLMVKPEPSGSSVQISNRQGWGGCLDIWI